MEEYLDIQRATEQDSEIIALLGRVTFDDTMGELFVNKEELFNYYDREFSVDKIESRIKNPNNIYWIARYKGLPVGYLKLKIHSPLEICPTKNTSEIQRVFILKDFVNKGVGHAFHRVLMEEIDKLPTEYLWIPILEENIPAQNFYEKNGFKKEIKHLFSISRYDLTFDIYVQKVK